MIILECIFAIGNLFFIIMLLYIMGDSNTTQAGGSDTTPLTPVASVNVNFKQVSEGLDEAGMKTLYEVLSKCRDAIEMAHSNGKEAFKYQIEVERFLKKNTVFESDNKSVDYEKSNPKVNFKALETGMFYVGNRDNWMDFASQYVGKWTKEKKWGDKSDYIFEGKHIHDGHDLKETGVETLKDDLFYGKFAKGIRTSGVYTWSNTSNYMGNFQSGNVHGFGCLKRKSSTSEVDEFIFGEFSNNYLPKSYILKRGKSIDWVSNNTSTELSKDQASHVSYYLNKVTEDFKQLGIWTEGLHKLEDKTGLNRTGLYAIAALGLAGVGFWAYKKFRKSITQKNKALSKAEKARITREKNKAEKAAAVSASASDSNSASAIEGNSALGSASAMESNASAPAATRKNKSASKSATRKAAAVKAAATRAANKAAKAANVKVEGSNVKVEGSNAVWSSPAESKEDVSNATGSNATGSNATGSNVEVGLRRSQRIRANKSNK